MSSQTLAAVGTGTRQGPWQQLLVAAQATQIYIVPAAAWPQNPTRSQDAAQISGLCVCPSDNMGHGCGSTTDPDMVLSRSPGLDINMAPMAA